MSYRWLRAAAAAGGGAAAAAAKAHGAFAAPPPHDHGYDYDLFVIGAGSGGMRAVKKAKTLYKLAKVGCCDMPFSQVSTDTRSVCGKNTVGGVGGTCVIRGCVPKKYFWYCSHYAHEFADAKGYGWDVDVRGHDWGTLLKKKRAETERLHKSQAEKRIPGAGADVLVGRGKLLDAHRIYIGEPANKTVSAQTILIATGTTASAIDIPGKEHCISSDHILELEACPRKLAVIGAGFIACEFACMFSAWGCDTHLIYRKETPLRGFDDDCRKFLARNFASHGTKCHSLHTPERVEKQANGKYSVTIKGPDGEKRLDDCDEVLMATGRHPNTWELGCAAAGVELDGRGTVKVDEYNRTNVPNIFAIGDVTDRMQLTPVAIQEAMAFLQTVYGGRPRKLNYDLVASAVFTQPPMGTCGLTEEDAVRKYANVDVYMDGHEGGWKPMVHDFSGSREENMVKVIVNADDDRVVGIHLVGKDAPEVIQGFGCAMQCGATKQDLYDTVAVHPSYAEEVVCIPGIDMMDPERRYRGGKPV